MAVRVVFLSSGGGGNLRVLHALAQRGALGSTSIVGVIADRDCPALDWADAEGIPASRQPYSRSQPDAFREALTHLAPDLIVTNLHKVLDDALVAHFDGRLVNLHYALLPAFGGTIGMEPVRRARAQGCRLVGATAHRVTTAVDAGPILAQACIVNDPQQPDAAVEDGVFRCGGVALAAAVEPFLNPAGGGMGGVLDAGGLTVFAAPIPRPAVCEAFRDAAFWESLRGSG